MPSRIFVRIMRLLYLTWMNVPALRPLADRLMERAFDTMAGDWDVRTGDVDRTAPLNEALSRIGFERGRVLEMGTGTGSGALEIAKRFEEAWVIGIDTSGEMIAAARRKATAAGAAVQFEVGRIQDTGFDPSSFDLIILINVPVAFDEIHRLLTAGGHAIVTFSRGPQTPFYSNAKRLERGFRRHAMLTVAAGSAGAGEFFITTKR